MKIIGALLLGSLGLFVLTVFITGPGYALGCALLRPIIQHKADCFYPPLFRWMTNDTARS